MEQHSIFQPLVLSLNNPSQLQISGDFDLTVNPAVAYITGLSSPRSRRVQRQALTVALLSVAAVVTATNLLAEITDRSTDKVLLE